MFIYSSFDFFNRAEKRGLQVDRVDIGSNVSDRIFKRQPFSVRFKWWCLGIEESCIVCKVTLPIKKQ